MQPNDLKWNEVWGIWIATSALVVSVINSFGLLISFYIQRCDRRPRLRVNFVKAYVHVSKKDEVGGTILYPVPGFKIDARNTTDKTIKVDSVYFLDAKKNIFELPKDWERITDIPSHEKRTMNISIMKFNEWAKIVKPYRPEKGRFVVEDALGNEHKTEKLGDTLSLEPLEEL